jgi:hypothetical protein
VIQLASTIGQRAQRLRESLQGMGGAAPSQRQMDALFGGSGNYWWRMERWDEKGAADLDARQLKNAIKAISAALLRVDATEQHAEQALRFVMTGDVELPWSSASILDRPRTDGPPPGGPSGPAQAQPKRSAIEAAAKGLKVLARFKAEEIDDVEALNEITSLYSQKNAA